MSRRSAQEIKALRMKFLNIAKSYLGVPYAKKYLTHEDKHYNSELFLDCCGLIRKVLRDMKEDLGFGIGLWNQAYQFDTLPGVIAKENLLPGDLVFISGKYFNKSVKQPFHDIVHVEIWLGDGEKTIGARWKKGVVELHDSYKFVSKNYHSMAYHFKSIDEWLHGNCASHCKEHPWLQTKYIDHNKYSIFSADSSDESNHDLSLKEIQEVEVPLQPKLAITSSISVFDWQYIFRNKKFCIGGKNGVLLVKTPLLDFQMRETDLDDDNFFFKWVECKRTISYAKFKPGEQIVNHIENISCLTTKAGLLKSLREYEKSVSKMATRRRCFKVADFFMESYLLRNLQEKQKFKSAFKEGEIWICKPSGRNQGKGIFLLTDINQLEEKEKSTSKKTTEYIIQRYIMNPLLIDKRKFDVRVYMLIASTNPQIVFYHPGYVRLACEPYSKDNLDLHIHLTNQYVQKKHPLYSSKKDETIMSFQQFNDYINEHVASSRELETNWVYKSFTKRMKQIMMTCFQACRYKLDQSEGTFDLLGFDFMIDENMKVWLIEININPALHTNCTILKETLPPIVRETIAICLEIYAKRKLKQSITDLQAVKHFHLLFHSQRKS